MKPAEPLPPASPTPSKSVAPPHTPSTMFLWVLALSAFSLNVGYGIVIPIAEALARRCGGDPAAALNGPEALTAIAVALMGFNLAKILGEIPGGIFSDRIGDRVVLSSSLFIYCVSVVMLIMARNYFPFITARFIEGFATGVSYPSMTSVLLKHSPQSRLGRNMSIAMGAGVAGIVLGPVIAAPLVDLSWPVIADPIDRPLYFALIFGLVIFAFTVAWFTVAAEKNHKTKHTAVTERHAVIADTVLAGAPGPAHHGLEGQKFVGGVVHEFGVIARFARSPVFLCLLAPLLFAKMVLTGWMVLLYVHVKVVFHATSAEAGVHYVGRLTAALALSIAIGTVIAGVIGDKISGKVLVHGSLIGLVSTLTVFVFISNPWIFVPVFIAHCVFAAILITIHLKTVGELYQEDQQHGRIFGIVHALSDLGTIFGPATIWLYTLLPGNTGPFVTFVVLAGLGALTIPAFLWSMSRAKELPRP